MATFAGLFTEGSTIFNARTWVRTTKVNTGGDPTESQFDSYLAAQGVNAILANLQRLAEVCDGTEQIDALDIADSLDVGGRAYFGDTDVRFTAASTFIRLGSGSGNPIFLFQVNPGGSGLFQWRQGTTLSTNDKRFNFDDGILRIQHRSASLGWVDALAIDNNGHPIFPTFTDATRGGAGTAGRVIFNSDDGQLNVDDGTNWTLPNGSTT